RTVLPAIPPDHDFVITLPDKVFYEALGYTMLSDLGITMIIRVDTKVSPRLTYGAFLLMGLRDYGYLESLRGFARFVRYYLPYVFPALWRLPWMAPAGLRRAPARPHAIGGARAESYARGSAPVEK